MLANIDDLRRTWETLGEQDPMWAVLTDPGQRGRMWDPHSFLASGEREVQTVMDRLAALGFGPNFAGEALDFGCGPGRLTQALARRFTAAHGVDIAEPMIRAARELTQCDTVVFHHNTAAHLRLFEDGAFTFVYSSIVLQHMHPALALGYIREFLRVLAPEGLLVFQIPDRRIEPRGLARVKTQASELLVTTRRRAAIGTRIRRRSLRLQGRTTSGPVMGMHAIAEDEMRNFFRHGLDGAIRDVAITNSADVDFNGDLRYLLEPPREGWVSKQYTVVRI